MNTPIAYESYQELADAYAAKVDTKPHNAFYDRPATVSLLPDLKGKNVLDAGCGPGKYLQIMSEMGAVLTGIDNSEKMLAHAAKRAGDSVRLKKQNLESPLEFADQEFEVIVSALAINYVQNLDMLFKEFYRILKIGGYLIFSTEHPFFTYLYHKLSNYFETQTVKCTWKGFEKKVDMASYHHSLSTLTNALLQNGFCIEKILEPKPIKEFQQYDQKDYEELNNFPAFMHIKARKP